MNEETKNIPEKKFRAGPISATIWRNLTEKGSYASVQISRNYKDASNTWKSTGSLRINDLPKAVLVLNKAYEYLTLKEYSSEKVYETESIAEIEAMM
jgi:hypothetical protein